MAEIEPGAVVAQTAEILGSVKIGAGSVVHPKGVLDGRSGPIVLGKGNVVEELAVIRNTTGAPLVIGDNNWFCVGSVVESARIGTGNVVEAKATLGAGSSLGDSNVIGALCTLGGGQAVATLTAITGALNVTRQVTQYEAGEQQRAHKQRLAYLTDMLPRSNKLLESTK